MTLSAGVVVVRKQDQDWKYLFLRAYRNWDFPKGVVDPGEEPKQTAIREAREEAGIEDLHFRWGDIYKETRPYSGGKKVARYYIAETTRVDLTLPVSTELGRPEHHTYRWFSYPEIKKRAPARLVPIVEWAESIINN